jgi:hypothetical protein
MASLTNLFLLLQKTTNYLTRHVCVCVHIYKFVLSSVVVGYKNKKLSNMSFYLLFGI